MGILGIHSDSMNDIFTFLGLEDLERLRSVCTRFKQEVDERVWHAVADRLEISQDNALEEPHKRVYRFLIDLRKSIRDLPQKQVPEEIKSIVAKGSDVPAIEQIKLLQKFRKGRDICVILKKLAEAINVQIPIIDYSKLKIILQTAKDFPSWINANQAALSSLQELDLSYKQLATLPPLGNFPSFWHLNLSHNRLTTLPALENFSSLDCLTFSHNQLTTLSTTLAHLTTSLKYLNVSHNRLATLPKFLEKFTSLKTLNASHNRLTALPALENLPLEHLNLSDNQLKTFPALERLTSLKTLNVSQNQLTFLDGLYNSLAALPSGFNKLLTISGNPFSLLFLQAMQLGSTFSAWNLMATQKVRYALPLIALGGVYLGSDYLTAGAQHIANAFFS